MRFVLLLAASAQLAQGFRGQRELQASYPLCTAAATALFTDNLSAASNGCTDTISYKWDGDDDPTDAQRSALCSCTVKPFNVPKCYWTKLKKYDINAAVHFGFAYNCSAISGKATPKVTEVDPASTPVPTTAAPKTPTPKSTTAAPKDPSAATDCTVKQVSAFTNALTTASGGCMATTSYNWGGSTNPTDQQYAEICKCTTVSPFDIPACSVEKGPDKVVLSVHYNWVRSTQCPTFSPPPEKKTSSNVGLIAGIAGGVVVVVLIIVIFLCKRNRKAKQEQYQPQDEMNAVLSPIGYQPLHVTPQTGKTSTDQRPSGVSTGTHTTISTTNGSLYPSNNSSGRLTEGGKWDDPVIMAVRIPHDSIFFGSLISRGGFGEVYRGTYKGETVAIKQLLADRRKDLGQIDDFLGEVKLMSSLEHERIVKFIGVAWNSLSDACMVVQFMENGDLRSVLGRWDSGPEKRPNGFDADKMKIALHVAHALVYLHSLNPVVVHRDLKSKNILLDANFDAKLTDFGISRERAESTMTAGVGSALWMAPEVMMGARYDEKADIFSFGVVLSELDTHQLPYFHAKVTESGQKLPEAALLQQVMAGRISVGFTDRANPQLVQLGRECVNVDPKARPTTAQVLHRVHQAMRQ